MIFFSFLFSIPVILVVLYYSRIIGILLIIGRLLLKGRVRNTMLVITMVILGVILLIPRYFAIISEYIPRMLFPLFSWIGPITQVSFYDKLYSYGHFLIVLGIVLGIIGLLICKVFNIGGGLLLTYISNEACEEARISRKNDMIIKEKQIKSKNTKYVRCPYCGGDNLINSDNEKCKYCRRQIS